jgi:hypothetical protein
MKNTTEKQIRHGHKLSDWQMCNDESNNTEHHDEAADAGEELG